MYKKKKIFALVIARKNSRRLKNKNLLPLKKKPLFYWTLKSALNSRYIDRICLSSDIAKSKLKNINHKKVFFDKRPKKLCSPNASVYSVINYIEKKYIKEGTFDILVLLQSTSPFRNFANIDDSIKLYCKNTKAKTLISVIKLNRKYNHILNKKNKMPLLEQKNIYVPNGAIFIKKIKQKNFKTFYDKTAQLYEMPFLQSLDIDYPEDYKIAKYFENKLK